MTRISVAILISRPQETSSIETLYEPAFIGMNQCLTIGENASGKLYNSEIYGHLEKEL